MSSLPPELIHFILRNLREDTPTLKQCALVNRLWRREAQSLLFKTHFVRIESTDENGDYMQATWSGQQSPYEFIQMMVKSPHLKSLIRAMKLIVWPIPQDAELQDQWSMDDLFSPLLDGGLERLDELVLVYPIYEEDMEVLLPQLEIVDPTLQAAFASVTQLCLWGIINPPCLTSMKCFLCCFPRLHYLLWEYLPIVDDQSTGPDSVPTLSTLRLQRLDFGAEDVVDQDYRCVFMKWLSQTNTVNTLEHMTFLDEFKTPHLADFIGALSKPWSLHVKNGSTLYYRSGQVSSSTLTEVTIDCLCDVSDKDTISTTFMIDTCKYLNAPALHTARWTLDTKVQHIHFKNVEEKPTIFHDQFPALKRVDIQFRGGATKQLWNCSALKVNFERYHDLEFTFSVPAFDWPMPSQETKYLSQN